MNRRVFYWMLVTILASTVAASAQPPATTSTPIADDIIVVPDTYYVDSMPDNDGYFFQYDYLLWSMNAPSVSKIGDPAAERLVTVNGISYLFTNSLDTNWIDENFTSGHRWEFGNQGIEGNGWIGSVIYGQNEQQLQATGVDIAPNDPYGLLRGYQDSNNDGIDDDLNLNNIYGRHGQDLGTPDSSAPSGYVLPLDGTPDQGAPIDMGDQVFYLITFGDFQVHNVTTLAGVEFMYTHRVSNWRIGRWSWFGGMRYLSVEDQFGFSGTGGVLDATILDASVQNSIVGPQIGARWIYRNGFFSLTSEGRFLAGLNAQRSTLAGQMGTNAQGTGTNEPAALKPTAFHDANNDTVFAPLGEVRVDGRFFINRYAAFRIGYTGMYAGGIGRAAPKVVYELPSFGLTNAASNESLFVHALTLGFEINR